MNYEGYPLWRICTLELLGFLLCAATIFALHRYAGLDAEMASGATCFCAGCAYQTIKIERRKSRQ